MKRQLLHMVVHRDDEAPTELRWYARHVWVADKGVSHDQVVASGVVTGVVALDAREAVVVALRSALQELEGP